MVILKGKVTPNAMGIYNPGSELGAAILMAAGTAMYEALAASIEKMKRFPMSCIKNPEVYATRQPLIAGTTIANILKNKPYFLKEDILLAVTIPISNKNKAKKPLKISVVNGLIPSACLLSAIIPIIKLPKIIKTLPLVIECLIILDVFSLDFNPLS